MGLARDIADVMTGDKNFMQMVSLNLKATEIFAFDLS